MRSTARRDDDEYLLNGSKTFITNGQLANFIIVVAKTDPAEGAKGTSLIVVETDGAEGFERGRNLHKIGMEANDTSELFFNDVKVPAENVIGGGEGQGFIQLMQQLPQERLNIAVQGVAAAERGLHETLNYVKERKAFGKRVIDFQNTQFKLAEVKTKALLSVLSDLQAPTRTLVVDSKANDKLRLSIRNAADKQFLPPEGINVYDLLRHDHLVLSKDAVKAIELRCSNHSSIAQGEEA